MEDTFNRFISNLKKELRIFLSVGFGVFLFVLFFQPYPLNRFDFNNYLLYVGGLGMIVVIALIIVRIIIFPSSGNDVKENSIYITRPFLAGLMILALSSVSSVFYLRFVGSVQITFFIVFKSVVINLAPVIVMGLSDYIGDLKEQNELLIYEKKIIQKQVERYQEDFLNKSIEFISENVSENFSLLLSEVIFIRSADNYVEIVFKEGDSMKRKLIRNTLKNIELQLKQFSYFLRCHRTCIVNIHFIEKLGRNSNNHWIDLKGFSDKIPVSRQYLLKLKESM